MAWNCERCTRPTDHSANVHCANCVNMAYRARKVYNLSLQAYDAMCAQPCAICGTTDRPRIVDHDHATGCGRGVLCTRCNLREGMPKYANTAPFIAYRAHSQGQR